MILVMGLGKTGQSAVSFLEKQGEDIIVYDENPAVIETYAQRGYRVLQTPDALPDGLDRIVKSPGIFPVHPILAAAREKNISIESDLEVFSRYIGAKSVIAVTGTNGKTTVTHMLEKIFASKDPIVAGNVGDPILEMAKGKDDLYILECSSFQLEDAPNFHPEVAILMNIEEDHMDWHGNFANYRAAKEKIYAQQTGDDLLICDADYARGIVPSRGRVSYFSSTAPHSMGLDAFMDADVLTVHGKRMDYAFAKDRLPYTEDHNLRNTMAALLAAGYYGLPASEVMGRLSEFCLDAHRMERYQIGERIVIDDSKATNPSASMAAMRSLSNESGKLHILLGGYDKKTELSPMVYQALEAGTVYAFGGIGPRIGKIAASYGRKIGIYDTLEQAVEAACLSSRPGDVLLLSPGASSFDGFANYKHRGDRFIEEAKRWLDEEH